LAGNIAYLCWTLMFAPFVIAFMMLKIAPAFQKIFMDFGAQLPTISRIGLGFSDEFGFVIFLVCLFLVFLLFYTALRYIGVITWNLPLMARVTRRLHAAKVLDSLAMAAERNQPLLKTVATLARCYPKGSIRRRLRLVLVDVASGIDFIESMRTWGLLSRSDGAVLSAAQRVGNLAWAMREVADSNRRRLAYRAQTWMQVLFPAAVVCMGLAVMFFYVSYFLPLIALIQRLT